MKSDPEISVIIPALNEEKVIARTLALLDKRACEIIVVDGGSWDRTVDIAGRNGARVLVSPAGRGRQLNHGAESARGEILLFLHADTILPENFQFLIRRALAEKGIVAGAFALGIDAEGFGYRLLEKGAAVRSSLLALPYGDQAIFLRKRDFQEAGGFPDLEIMEDVSLIKKLAGRGKIGIIPEKVQTSGRRWQRRGVVRVTLLNQLLLGGFFLGLSTRFLARCYYGRKKI